MKKTKVLKIPITSKDDNETGTRQLIIQYNNETEELASYLEKVINSNKYIFSDRLGNVDLINISSKKEKGKRTLNIETITDFKTYLATNMEPYRKELLKVLEPPTAYAEFLRVLLLDIITLSDTNEKIFPPREQFTQMVASIYTTLAAKLSESPENDLDFIDFLVNPTSEKKDQIFIWLNDNYNWDLLNLLLDEQYTLLTNSGEFGQDNLIGTHLDGIIEVIKDDFDQNARDVDGTRYPFPALSEDKLDELCVEFFTAIDPTLTLVKYYFKYKEKQIIYGEPTEGVDWCNFRGEDGTYLIVAPLSNTISDFRDLVHEVTHLISLEQIKENDQLFVSLIEFSAIFMELQAIKFLRTKGYPQEVLDALYQERTDWTSSSIIATVPVLELISHKQKQGTLTFEECLSHGIEIVGDVSNLSKEDQALLAEYIPYTEESVTAKCERINEYIVENPLEVVKAYPYTIGKYLAVKAMDASLTDNTLIPKFIALLPNLATTDPEIVVKNLSLDKTLPQKQYQKTEKPEA